jgi:hypothetical protein
VAQVNITIEIFYAGGCWNASFCIDGIETHLTDAFCTCQEALAAACQAILAEGAPP